jgi:hypothetical protein
MAVVNDSYRHLMHSLIIIYPRIDERVAKRYQEEENDHAFIVEHLLHLFPPDVADINNSII